MNVAQSGSDTTSPSLTTTASKQTDATTTPIITVTTPSKGAIHNITSSPKKVNSSTFNKLIPFIFATNVVESEVLCKQLCDKNEHERELLCKQLCDKMDTSTNCIFFSWQINLMTQW